MHRAGLHGGYDLMPGNEKLTVAEVRLLEFQEREFRLREALQGELGAQYDYIFIDCPPSLNMLTLNGLVAADSVIIPTQCEYYALEGLSALMQTIERVRMSANPELKIEGLLRTMFDSRNNLPMMSPPSSPRILVKVSTAPSFPGTSRWQSPEPRLAGAVV